MNDIFDSFDISTKTQLEVDTEVTGSRLLGKSHYLRHHYPKQQIPPHYRSNHPMGIIGQRNDYNTYFKPPKTPPAPHQHNLLTTNPGLPIHITTEPEATQRTLVQVKSGFTTCLVLCNT